MLTIEQMVARLIVALFLGGILGLEREVVGKEAGIRTEIVVAGGSALFTMLALMIPYVLSTDPATISDIIAHNSGFLTIIANIVVGIGFLGAGLIIKTGQHPHGLTTAALVWTTAAIGILSGLGLVEFAIIAALLIAAILYILRKLNVSERIEHPRDPR